VQKNNSSSGKNAKKKKIKTKNKKRSLMRRWGLIEGKKNYLYFNHLNFFIYFDYFFIVTGQQSRENIIENNIYINKKMMDYARKLFFNEVGMVTFLADKRNSSSPFFKNSWKI
jgi:hypothetical protein